MMHLIGKISYCSVSYILAYITSTGIPIISIMLVVIMGAAAFDHCVYVCVWHLENYLFLELI